jgi:hypothetical protein
MQTPTAALWSAYLGYEEPQSKTHKEVTAGGMYGGLCRRWYFGWPTNKYTCNSFCSR